MTDEGSHLYRRTDRETSGEAAGSLNLTVQEKAWERVKRYLNHVRWATYDQLCDVLINADLYPDEKTARRQVRTMCEEYHLLEYSYKQDGSPRKLVNKTGRKGQALQLCENPEVLSLVPSSPKTKQPPPAHAPVE